MNKLADLLPGKISTEPEDLICYGFDASGLEGAPAAVVWPRDSGDVVEVMTFASDNDIAVIPRGAGTGMTGGAIPSKGAVVISMEKMNRIIAVDAENLNVLVEPGVINGRLQRELAPRRLFYPPDPGSMNFCTIGGNVAENAGGPRALKYGVTRDYVMALEAVLPDGRVVHTGVRTPKGVVGYDLTRLLVGSEGTLAVVTKIRLKVMPVPEDVVTLLVLFRDFNKPGEAVTRIMSSGIIPRTLEFLDGEAVRAVENYRPVGLPKDVEALLIIELDGSAAAIRKEAERVSDICIDLGGSHNGGE
ncbi:MAG: FAD-binding protein [Candidatus Sulfobium sp.]